MSLLLDLPSETERALKAKAARLGLPLDRYAIGVLCRDAGDPEGGAIVFSGDRATRRAQLRQLLTAPPKVREATLRASAQAAAEYYATPEGREELADWRALDGEPFHDD